MERDLTRCPRFARWHRLLLLLCAVLLTMALAACDDGDDSTVSVVSTARVDAPDVNIGLPDSLTGGQATSASGRVGTGSGYVTGRQDASGCNFSGNGDADPTENGFYMTRFLVGIVSANLCLTESITSAVESGSLPTNGGVFGLPAELGGPGAPSHVSATLNSATQTTLRAYWNNDTDNPAMFLSWNITGNGVQGRLIMGGAAIGGGGGAPSDMRMDFDFTSSKQVAELYFAFPSSNRWMDGFRVEVTKALDGSFPAYVARGIMESRSSYDEGFASRYPDVVPTLKMYAVTDSAGGGAALASFSDVGLVFGSDVGDYKFADGGRSHFSNTGSLLWKNRSIASATYLGRRNSAVEASLRSHFNLASDYFQGSKCGDVNSDCTAFVNALFGDSSYVSTPDSAGSEPAGAAKDRLDAATNDPDRYLFSSAKPDGASTWDEVFEMRFTPTN